MIRVKPHLLNSGNTIVIGGSKYKVEYVQRLTEALTAVYYADREGTFHQVFSNEEFIWIEGK